MPWSEWIQSDPYERGTSARYKAHTVSGTQVDGKANAAEALGESETMLYGTTDATTTVYGQSAGYSPSASRAEDAAFQLDSGDWSGIVQQNQSVVWFDTDDLELATWREWFPNELYDLTEGVDYEVRPDRTGSEDDAFIEYEDGVGQIQNWYAFASGRILIHNASYSPKHATAKWRLLSPPPAVPAIPPTSGSVSASPVVFTPSAGTPVAQILNTTLVGSPSAVPVEVIIAGPVSEFAVLMITDESSDEPPTDPEIAAYGHEWVVSGLPSVAAAYVRLPRWRYWKPGQLPLRQRQRDDGLALRGAPSWRRGTSRQATNRWRSYL